MYDKLAVVSDNKHNVMKLFLKKKKHHKFIKVHKLKENNGNT